MTYYMIIDASQENNLSIYLPFVQAMIAKHLAGLGRSLGTTAGPVLLVVPIYCTEGGHIRHHQRWVNVFVFGGMVVVDDYLC